jgi:hypothetical protein
MDENLKIITQTILLAGFFLLLAFPLKNFLEIKNIHKKNKHWDSWVQELPFKKESTKNYSQNDGQIRCDYCDSVRQYSRIEMVIEHCPKFGLINNAFSKSSYFKSVICSGCNTTLYRERYEK